MHWHSQSNFSLKHFSEILKKGLCKRRTTMAEKVVDDRDKLFDVVVFGVTGVTGKHVALELKKVDVKWAVAGRNEQNCRKILQEIDSLKIPVMEADVENFESLLKMCQSAKVLLNCVGPYYLYGEPVLKACIESSCHYIDCSGEAQFIEKMQLLYHEEAKNAGVLIISACGFESIISEMGIEHLKKNFKGQLNSVDAYTTVEGGEKGYVINVGTFFSAVHCMSHILDMRRINRRLQQVLYTKTLPSMRHRHKSRGLVFYNNDVDGWCTANPFIDQRVAARTQRMNYELNDERPIQMHAYLNIKKSLFLTLFFVVCLGIVFLFSATRFGRYFLLKYPRVFTWGMFDFGGPTEEQIKDAWFSVVLYGRGWDKHGWEQPGSPHKTTKLEIKGPDPAYVTTAVCMVQSAMAILMEHHKMAVKSGILTPGIAFTDTTLVERLQKSGITFQQML